MREVIELFRTLSVTSIIIFLCRTIAAFSTCTDKHVAQLTNHGKRSPQPSSVAGTSGLDYTLRVPGLSALSAWHCSSWENRQVIGFANRDGNKDCGQGGACQSSTKG